jgi:hypothetical protein
MGRCITPMGKRKTEKDKAWILLSWTFRTCFPSSFWSDKTHHGLVKRPLPERDKKWILYCVRRSRSFLAHLAFWWSVPSTTTGSPWTSLSILFRYPMALPQRSDDGVGVVGVVDLMVSHSQHLTSSSAGPSRKACVPARSLLGMTQASLLSLCWRPLSLSLAGVCESCA